jgi:hypothetical protein
MTVTITTTKTTDVVRSFAPFELFPIGCSEIMCKSLFHEQENGEKWWMDAKLKLFCAGKFVVSGHDLWK